MARHPAGGSSPWGVGGGRLWPSRFCLSCSRLAAWAVETSNPISAPVAERLLFRSAGIVVRDVESLDRDHWWPADARSVWERIWPSAEREAPLRTSALRDAWSSSSNPAGNRCWPRSWPSWRDRRSGNSSRLSMPVIASWSPGSLPTGRLSASEATTRPNCSRGPSLPGHPSSIGPDWYERRRAPGIRRSWAEGVDRPICAVRSPSMTRRWRRFPSAPQPSSS
jgi:hypothetical protein